MRFNTSLLHAGVTKETNGSTLPPVYQTSAFEQESAADLEKIFENKRNKPEQLKKMGEQNRQKIRQFSEETVDEIMRKVYRR